VEVYRTPEERFQGLPGYPFAPHYLEMEGYADTPLRMHYLDEGGGAPVLLLHGEPTWSFLYRKVIPVLVSAGHRAVAPDYFGFGRSDKPVALDWYTFDRHVEVMQDFIARLDLRGATLVVQDWGGPIGMRVLAAMPERFERLVILNTGILSGSGDNRMSEAWWSFRNFIEKVKPDIPVGMLVSGACFVPPEPEVLAGYEAPFPVPESKWGAAAFPLIVPTSADSPGAPAALAAGEFLRGWEKPTLVAFSDSDPIFPTSVGERFVERIPGAGPMVTIRQASHFLQEDRGEEVAAHIVDFLRANPLT
jgi:haloalkane dehalogenase